MRRLIGLLIAAFVITPVLAGISVSPAAAAGTVGDGTAGSCTEQALRDAINGGGLVTFDCPEDTSIQIEDEIEIVQDTEIRGSLEIGPGLLPELDDLVALEAVDSRIFRVSADVTLNIDGIALTGGNTEGAGGAILNEAGSLELSNMIFVGNRAASDGGAISSAAGQVTVNNSLLVGNESTANSGGAILVSGSALSLNRVSFIGNEAAGLGGAVASFFNSTVDIEDSFLFSSVAQQGGAIYLLGTASTTIVDSFLVENEAAGGSIFSGDGGAIEVGSGNLDIVRSSIVLNEAAGYGGGISRYGSGDVTISQSTISGNVAHGSNIDEDIIGGGIYNNFEQSSGGSMTIANSTIVNNVAPNGFGDGIAARAETNITNSIVAYNGDQNCVIDFGMDGSINSNGHNISDDHTCPFNEDTDLIGTDPMLGEFELDETDDLGSAAHFPQEGSPAIGGGPATCESPDQRGMSRPQGMRCDIGAIEIEMPTDLCMNRYNGDLRAPRVNACASTEAPHFFEEQGALDVCVNRYNGDVRYSRTGACASTEMAQIIEGDGTFNVCINRYNGDVRVPRVEGQCASTETSTNF